MSKWKFHANQRPEEYWKNRALFAEWAVNWSQKVSAKKPRNAGMIASARAWYLRNLHMKPGEAAEKIHKELLKQKYEPPKELRTIINWIKDLANPEVSGRGRPTKK